MRERHKSVTASTFDAIRAFAQVANSFVPTAQRCVSMVPLRDVPAVPDHPSTERTCPGHDARCVLDVRRLESAPEAAWDAAACASPQAHLGMASAWFAIIRNAYGHRPFYVTAQPNDGGDPVILPAFLVHRWPFGTTLTSMPFLDAGGPTGGTRPLRDAALARILLEAQARGAAQIELRCLSPLNLAVPPSLEKVTLIRSLPSDPDSLWRELDTKVRNQIRKAERSGISVETGRLDLLDEFYRVFAVNMRDLGSPVHSKEFFRQLLHTFGSVASVVIARKGAAPVGGLIAITYGETRYVPWASTLRSHNASCPNMLMYWETLRRACLDGIAQFDFGRSTRGSGTHRFKTQWGATDRQLYWYTANCSQDPAARRSSHDRTLAVLSGAWKRLPVFVTRAIGPTIRKRLTQ